MFGNLFQYIVNVMDKRVHLALIIDKIARGYEFKPSKCIIRIDINISEQGEYKEIREKDILLYFGITGTKDV